MRGVERPVCPCGPGMRACSWRTLPGSGTYCMQAAGRTHAHARAPGSRPGTGCPQACGSLCLAGAACARPGSGARAPGWRAGGAGADRPRHMTGRVPELGCLVQAILALLCASSPGWGRAGDGVAPPHRFARRGRGAHAGGHIEVLSLELFQLLGRLPAHDVDAAAPLGRLGCGPGIARGLHTRPCADVPATGRSAGSQPIKRACVQERLCREGARGNCVCARSLVRAPAHPTPNGAASG